MLMRGAKLGTYSLVFAAIVLVGAALHYLNVVPLLNTLLAPLLSLFGALLGLMGYFERDKRKALALVGMVANFLLLAGWIGLFVAAMKG